jgi:[protein-PII] uridylyltransferase
MDLVDALNGHKAIVERKKRKTSMEMTFCTIDKPYRLSQLCGVLTLNDCNILFANAFTRTDGKVIDVFYVEDISGTSPIDDARTDLIQTDLDDILEGRLNVNKELERHIVKWKRRKVSSIPVSAKVEFENDISGDVTIIDIFAQDQPGLLYKLTRALSDEGLTIHRARISTEANRVIDSFDVHDKSGKKIADVDKLESIRQRLLEALDYERSASSPS